MQEFIKKNFKKPISKPKNSTTIELEQQQMSIDDLLQGSSKEIDSNRQSEQIDDKEIQRIDI